MNRDASTSTSTSTSFATTNYIHIDRYLIEDYPHKMTKNHFFLGRKNMEYVKRAGEMYQGHLFFRS